MENTGQIVKSKKNGKSRYTPISNDILQSKILTPEEKSILVHLLSLPEDWVVYKSLIWQEMNIGRNKFNNHWKGLVEKGYIVSIRVIDTNTNLVRGWNHIVYEEPIMQNSDIPSSDLPKFGLSENHAINKVIIEQSNNILNNNIENNNIVPKEENFEVYSKQTTVNNNLETIEDIEEFITSTGKTLSDNLTPKYFLNNKTFNKLTSIEDKITFIYNQLD